VFFAYGQQRSLFEKAYHFVKNIALKNKLELINSLQPAKGRILDIGAGTGDFICCKTKRLANHRWSQAIKQK
jgi:ubiquinone/menaquinone biosynthesis C-methylase UbiE